MSQSEHTADQGPTQPHSESQTDGAHGAQDPQTALQANPGWASGQLSRARQALATALAEAAQEARQTHPTDGAMPAQTPTQTAAQTTAQLAIARALAKLAAWQHSLLGMQEGRIRVGSRTPNAGVPAWVTPEVLHGGFASGGLAAGGGARAHEQVWQAQLQAGQALGTSPQDCAQIQLLDVPRAPRRTLPTKLNRAALNDWFMTEAGFAQLLRWLDDGCWRIRVPEEGALLVVAWLLREGHDTHAERLLRTLSPWWGQLRFFPMPAATPMAPVQTVSVTGAAEVMATLNALQTPPAVMAQHEAIHIWRPRQDALVSLWLAAVDGEVPQLLPGTREAAGGLPVAMPPADWRAQAAAWLAGMRQDLAAHPRCTAHRKAKHPMAQMQRLLERVLGDVPLADAERLQLRFLIACQVSAHGVPGSAQHQQWRAAQVAQADTVWRANWAGALAQRLQAQGPYGDGDGMLNLAACLHNANAAEAQATQHVPEGTVVWRSLRRKIKRAYQADVPSLVAQGVVPSSEVLASLLPALTGEQWAARMPDAASARLMGALWRAFRRRRSLLLLNFESQVRFHELPWVLRLLRKGDEPAGAGGDATGTHDVATMTGMGQANALAQLNAAAQLALTQFPQSPFPNPMLWELGALGEQGGWATPWVEEIAADIFMGRFVPKFGCAVHAVLPWLRGSLYARYYRIDAQALHAAVMPAVEAERAQAAYSASARSAPNNQALKQASKQAIARWNDMPDPFVAHLRQRVGVPAQDGGIAVNGAVVEQMLVVSTANLAPLAMHFDWARTPARWQAAATQAFAHLCAQLQLPVRADEAGQPDARVLAERVRRAGASWRQVVFLLSLLPAAEQAQTLQAMATHLPQSHHVAGALRPMLADLRACVTGDARPNVPIWYGWAPHGTHAMVQALLAGR